MKILKEGIVHRVTQGPFRYQAWPTVCIDEQGVLYAVCSGNRSTHVCPFGKNLMFISRDGGDSWSLPKIINDTWLDDRDSGITYLGNGEMLLSYFNHPKDVYTGIWRDWVVKDAEPMYRPILEGYMQVYEQYPEEYNTAGSYIRKSTDYGNSWGEPVRVPISAPHGAVKTQSGRLLFLGKDFPGVMSRYVDLPDTDDPVPPEDRGMVFLYESFDGGESWVKLSRIDKPEGTVTDNLHEPHIIELPSGELIAAIRGQGEPVYHGFSMFFASSTDGGRSWSKPWSCSIAGSPPHMMLLPDGAVLLSYGRREAPCGIRAVISRDGCRSFGEEMEISKGINGDLGYPSTVMLPDGTLLTVYYKLYGSDNRTSIMYTKWTLEE